MIGRGGGALAPPIRETRQYLYICMYIYMYVYIYIYIHMYT
jgi:hypothetical protein